MAKQPQIEAIIFDVDGVVFQSQGPDGKYLWSKTIKDDLGVGTQHFKKIFPSAWDNVTRGKINTKDYLKTVFEDELFHDLNLTPEQYIDYWLSHDNHVNLKMIEFVQSLTIPAYLGTNQDPYRTAHIRALVENSFKGCFASYEIGYIKPESGFFEHIEKALNLQPHQLLLIDDTPANIEGGKARGWNAYLYKDNLEELKLVVPEYNLPLPWWERSTRSVG